MDAADYEQIASVPAEQITDIQLVQLIFVLYRTDKQAVRQACMDKLQIFGKPPFRPLTRPECR